MHVNGRNDFNCYRSQLSSERKTQLDMYLNKGMSLWTEFMTVAAFSGVSGAPNR